MDVARVRTPRTRWIDAGMRALADGGPERVRVEPLAAELGVSKGGFYWQFADRRALLEEILDAWERTVLDEVIDRVEAGGGDARAKLRRLSGLAGAGGEALEVEPAIRDWARRDESVAARLRRVDNRRMDYMRSLFTELCGDEREAEVRSLTAFSLFIGDRFIAADSGRRGRKDVMARAVWRLLE